MVTGLNFDRSPAFYKSTPLWDGLKIGLYGGSFNPAHKGHYHIGLEALKRLDLDAMWWLVTPGNPLKGRRNTASLDDRLAQACEVARHPKLFVTGVENELGTHYTADAVKILQQRHRRSHFVWVMGSDNLATFHRWHAWREIMMRLPIAVLARPGYSKSALASPAARKFQRCRVGEHRLKRLVKMKPPCWAYVQIPQFDVSATALRTAARGDWEQAAAQAKALSRAGVVKAQQQEE